MADGARYECHVCRKAFGSKQNLSRHSKTHNAERKHSCPICAKSFTRSDLLKRHAQLHGPDSESLVDMPSPHKRPRMQLDTPASIVPQFPVLENADQANIHPVDLETLDWPSWDETSILSYDQLPEDIFSETSPWQSYITHDHLPDFMFDAEVPLPQIGSHNINTTGRAASSDAEDHVLPSAAPSPPNEASHEDRTPFAWDPGSRRITNPVEVTLSPQDPLVLDQEPRMGLSASRYQQLKIALAQTISFRGIAIVSPMTTMPSLQVINTFLTRFARCFLPQAPVLHLPTLKINEDCPDYLLSVMIAIGAIYCRRRHVRRFAIALQELARCHLKLAVDSSDVLLKDQTMVYGAALICYAGLWCGNKRAFELAEALRGSVIVWARRLSNHTIPIRPEQESDVQDLWRSWVRSESHKRLLWTVYVLDCQAASLLSTTPYISLTEVIDWDCPCDDEYWNATSARQCNLLLGHAAVPPSRAFAAALGPFINGTSKLQPLRRLNDYSTFLVLLAINMNVLRYAESRDISSKLAHVTADETEHDQSGLAASECDLEKQKKILDSLELWNQMYGQGRPSGCMSSDFFQAAGRIVLDLCHFQMHTSINDLQAILGKSGKEGFQQARSRFETWFTIHPASTREIVNKSIDLIETHRSSLIEHRRSNQKPVSWSVSSLTPYSTILLFLTYTFLYACGTAMTPSQRRELIIYLVNDRSGDGEVHSQKTLVDSLQHDRDDPTAKSILRDAAHMLALFDNWGCSTNLALLLHWRSKLN